MAFRASLLASAVVGASAAKYTRGFVPSTANANAVTEVATITDEDRNNAPVSIDWSQKGATTAVKNQGNCGSCWAFSATEAVESAVFMKTGKLPAPLSTEQLVDCDGEDSGCDGGDTSTAMQYIEKAGGQDSASDYKDRSSGTGTTQKCSWDHEVAVSVTGYKWAVPPCKSGACNNQNEKDLAAAVAKYGPISICVNANDAWESYAGGILKGKCAHGYNTMNHCTQLVGYDLSGSEPYWKVRNSWGSDFGENGFIRLPFGENACSVASWPLFPSVAVKSSNATLIV